MKAGASPGEDAAVETDKLIYLPDEANSRLPPSVTLPGWNIGTFAITTSSQTYDTNYGDIDLPTGASSDYARAVVSITLTRPGTGLFFKLFSGVFAAAGIALLAIAIRPTDLDPRFGLPVGAIFRRLQASTS